MLTFAQCIPPDYHGHTHPGREHPLSLLFTVHYLDDENTSAQQPTMEVMESDAWFHPGSSKEGIYEYVPSTAHLVLAGKYHHLEWD